MTTLKLNKPFQVLTQFSADGAHKTLADFVDIPDVYPAGRLDHDSEGLLLLTDDGLLQHKISHPDFKLEKTYWVRVEGDITFDAIAALENGVKLKDGLTKPAKAFKMAEPTHLWERHPPIRQRASIPTSWLSLSITEGRNRQVRRMTAAVGFPTLRLIRYAIGPIHLDGLNVGEFQAIDEAALWSLFPKHKRAKPSKPRTTFRRR